VIDDLTRPDAREDVILLGEPIGRNDHRDVTSHRFGHRPAEHPLGPPIPRRDDTIEPLGDEGFVRGVDDRGETGLRFVLRRGA
jgi:hypothetical protein